MAYLFYGENSYLIDQKTKLLKSKFLEKYPEAEIVTLNGAELLLKNYLPLVGTVSFFSNKKMIIIKNLLENKNKSLRDFLVKNIEKPSEDILVLIENKKPKASDPLFKKLNTLKSAQYFPYLEGKNLADWILKKCQSLGMEISPEALAFAISLNPKSLNTLENELEKTSLYLGATGKKIIQKTDLSSIRSETDISVFEFIESLARGNTPKTIKLLEQQLDSGQNEFYLFTMIVYQFRTLLMIKEMNSLSSSGLAQTLKISPFAASKGLSIARDYSLNELKNIYYLLSSTDIKLKTGEISPDLAFIKIILFIKDLKQAFHAS